MTFVDLTKALDSQSWGTLENYGKVWLSCQIHSNGAAVPWWYARKGQNDGEFSDPFPVTNGVKKGCVLASTLFSMMFSTMLTDAFQDGDNGILIRYRFDGRLFNQRRLQVKSKVQIKVLDDFLFADDMAKGAPTEEKMQKGVDQVSDSCDSYDLTISIKTTEVVYQPAPRKPYKEPTIHVKGQRLQVVEKFIYLGSTLSRVVHIDDEVNARIAKANAAFGRLRGSIWGRSGDLKQNWKYTDPWCRQQYCTHAKPGQLTNGMQKNEPLSYKLSRKLLKIKWQDRIPDKGPEKGRDAECTYSSEIGTVKMDRPCYQNAWWMFSKENPLWRTTNRKASPWWSEEAIQGHPPLKISTYQQSHGNRLHRIEQSGEAS